MSSYDTWPTWQKAVVFTLVGIAVVLSVGLGVGLGLKNKNTVGEWYIGPMSACDKNCGLGHQTQPVTCVDTKTQKQINDSKCTATKPQAAVQQCNTFSCAPWAVQSWGDCQCPAKIQTRGVVCPAVCDESVKPASTQACQC